MFAARAFARSRPDGGELERGEGGNRAAVRVRSLPSVLPLCLSLLRSQLRGLALEVLGVADEVVEDLVDHGRGHGGLLGARKDHAPAVGGVLDGLEADHGLAGALEPGLDHGRDGAQGGQVQGLPGVGRVVGGPLGGRHQVEDEVGEARGEGAREAAAALGVAVVLEAGGHVVAEVAHGVHAGGQALVTVGLPHEPQLERVHLLGGGSCCSMVDFDVAVLISVEEKGAGAHGCETT